MGIFFYEQVRLYALYSCWFAYSSLSVNMILKTLIFKEYMHTARLSALSWFGQILLVIDHKQKYSYHKILSYLLLPKTKGQFKVFKLIIFMILIFILCDLPSNDHITDIINAWVTIIFIPDLRMYSPPPLKGLDLSEFLISVSHSWIHTKHNSSTRHHNSKASGPRLHSGEPSWLHLTQPLSTQTE